VVLKDLKESFADWIPLLILSILSVESKCFVEDEQREKLALLGTERAREVRNKVSCYQMHVLRTWSLLTNDVSRGQKVAGLEWTFFASALITSTLPYGSNVNVYEI
jgi:hypothetical protein